jgi:hypothetical protein
MDNFLNFIFLSKRMMIRENIGRKTAQVLKEWNDHGHHGRGEGPGGFGK